MKSDETELGGLRQIPRSSVCFVDVQQRKEREREVWSWEKEYEEELRIPEERLFRITLTPEDQSFLAKLAWNEPYQNRRILSLRHTLVTSLTHLAQRTEPPDLKMLLTVLDTKEIAHCCQHMYKMLNPSQVRPFLSLVLEQVWDPRKPECQLDLPSETLLQGLILQYLHQEFQNLQEARSWFSVRSCWEKQIPPALIEDIEAWAEQGTDLLLLL